MNFYRNSGVPAVAALILIASAVLLYVQTPTFDTQKSTYTELWILDANHMADNFPFNITRNTDYSLFLGISNHLGASTCYQVKLKSHNSTQTIEDNSVLAPSSFSSIYNLTISVADNESWKLPITLSFNYDNNSAQRKITLRSITFNGNVLNIENGEIHLDEKRNGYFENLIFELWIQNDNLGTFEYHGRRVELQFSLKP